MTDDDLGPDELVTGDYWEEKTGEEEGAAVIFDPVHYMRRLSEHEAADLTAEIREGWGGAPAGGAGDAELFQKILSHDYWRPVTESEQATLAELYDDK